MHSTHTATSRVENSGQVSSCQLKFVHVPNHSSTMATFHDFPSPGARGGIQTLNLRITSPVFYHWAQLNYHRYFYDDDFKTFSFSRRSLIPNVGAPKKILGGVTNLFFAFFRKPLFGRKQSK